MLTQNRLNYFLNYYNKQFFVRAYFVTKKYENIVYYVTIKLKNTPYFVTNNLKNTPYFVTFFISLLSRKKYYFEN